MLKTYNQVTDHIGFYGKTNPQELVAQFGSPLYVYNEDVFRSRCREVKNLVDYDNFSVNYSVKANSNLTLVSIARQEGLNVDAMSPGEIYLEEKAGYQAEEILYISNNVSEEEMQYAIDKGIIVSVDSLSQLEMFGRLNKGGNVCVRFNPGVGAGHHEKVVTGGKKTKFGVSPEYIDDVKSILNAYDLTLIGINQHIGSLFMTSDKYILGIKSVMEIAKNFDTLEFLDFGGGFGIPYEKLGGQERLDLEELGNALNPVLESFAKEYQSISKTGHKLKFKIEPGRYVVAESGVLLGSVFAKKHNYNMTYVGTDLGFNVLKRPVMYDSHHDIEIYRVSDEPSRKEEIVNIVGNICESGDIIAKDRKLPEIFEGDIIGVLDAGAYGFCMSSNYNNRLRPAEVLIQSDGTPKLIRKRETLDDLLRSFDI